MGEASVAVPDRVDLHSTPAFALGRAQVDPAGHEIHFGQSSVRIQPQALKVLVALHDRCGEVVSREELLERCWDGRAVSDDVINRCALILRQVASRCGDFRIETVPRAGYRLKEISTKAPAPRRRTHRTLSVIAAGTVLLVLSAGVIWWRLHPETAAPREELAVLVKPLTSDEGDRLGRQLARRATDAAVQMLIDSGVSVISDEAAAAARPADALPLLVLSGSVSTSGPDIVAHVTLDEPRRGATILSHDIRASPHDAMMLPDRVGANVAGSLSWADRFIAEDSVHPADSAMMSQLLDQFSNEEFDFWRSYDFARRHAPQAPNSPVAQWQLAMLTGMLIHGLDRPDRPAAVQQARRAAERALSLDPQVGDFQIPWCLLHAQVELVQCEQRLRQGLATDPQAAWATGFLANLMYNVGRTQEAETLQLRALDRDEYAPAKLAHSVMILEAEGDGQAAEVYKRAVQLWPNSRVLFRLRIRGLVTRGDFHEIARIERDVGPSGLPKFYDPVLPLAAAVQARSLPEAKLACPKTGIDQKIAACMIAFAQLGDLDDAFAFADEVYPTRLGRSEAENDALWFKDPFVLDTAFLAGRGAAPLRDDPRYLALADRVGLLRYWRTVHLPDFCTRTHEAVCAAIELKPTLQT